MHLFDSLVQLCSKVDLHPSGKVMMVVQYFLEGADAGKVEIDCSTLLFSSLPLDFFFLNIQPSFCDPPVLAKPTKTVSSHDINLYSIYIRILFQLPKVYNSTSLRVQKQARGHNTRASHVFKFNILLCW